LVSSPEGAVAFLRSRLKPAPLKPAPPPDPRRIRKLIAALDSAQFKTRADATKELEEVGESALPAVRQALADSNSPEARRRLSLLLKKLDPAGLPPALLRQLRAVEALAGVGTPEARRLLEALAAGHPAARLTQEAREAL